MRSAWRYSEEYVHQKSNSYVFIKIIRLICLKSSWPIYKWVCVLHKFCYFIFHRIIRSY